MVTLYLCPPLFGLPDNNPFGLKVDAFLRLAQVDFTIEPVLDTSNAPRNQLPYVDDNGTILGDSNTIIDHFTKTRNSEMDASLTEDQRQLHFLIVRMLDMHLYWVMSYSRWQDERYYTQFRDALMAAIPGLTVESMNEFREYNMKKYHAQGLGRYTVEEVYQQGIDNLRALTFYLGEQDYLFGKNYHVVDACCYGFLANIYYFDIDTPLKRFLLEQGNLVKYTERLRGLMGY